jgi:transcriptional regulator with XRE-family HTH domain
MPSYRFEPGIHALVGGHVRRLRTEQGLTQEDVAEGMVERGFGWTRVTVAEIEGGKRRITIDEWLGLALVFAVPAISLLIPEDRVRVTTDFAALTGDDMRLLLHEGSLGASDEVRQLESQRYQVEETIRELVRQQENAQKQIDEQRQWLDDFEKKKAEAEAAGSRKKARRKTPPTSTTTRGAKAGESR